MCPIKAEIRVKPFHNPRILFHTILSIPYYSIPYSTIAYCCILLHTVAYCCILLHTVAYCCILLHTVAYCCILLHTVAYCCIPFCFLNLTCTFTCLLCVQFTVSPTASWCEVFGLGRWTSGDIAPAAGTSRDLGDSSRGWLASICHYKPTLCGASVKTFLHQTCHWFWSNLRTYDNQSGFICT